MARCVILLTGSDRPGSLVTILEQLTSFRIESAWLRAVGSKAGGIMLMICDDTMATEALISSVSRACACIQDSVATLHTSDDDAVHRLAGRAQPVMARVLPCASGFTPRWLNHNPQIVFSVIGKQPNQTQLATMMGNLIATDPTIITDEEEIGYDISQHDSAWVSPTNGDLGNMFVRNTLRLTQLNHRPAGINLAQGRYELQRAIQQSFTQLAIDREEFRDYRVEFTIPSGRQMAPFVPPLLYVQQDSKLHQWYSVRLIIQDIPRAFESAYQCVTAGGLHVDRSCCRGLGGVGYLIFAGRPNTIGIPPDPIQFEEALTEHLDQGLIVGDHIEDPLVTSMNHHPFDFYRPRYRRAVNVFHTSFSRDSKGLLLAISRLLVSRNGSESIYFMDGKPSVEHDHRFTVRMGVVYDSVETARLRAIATTATLLARSDPFEDCDRVSCETFELETSPESDVI